MAKTKPIFDNPHVTLPGADLYRGDCLAVLPHLQGPYDAVVTDPPYSSGGASKGARGMSTGRKYLNSDSTLYPDFAGDAKDQRSYLHWSALWMGLCFDRLTDGGLMVVFSDWRQLPVTSDALQAAGFVWRGVAVWDKTGAARPYKGGYRNQSEFILWGSKGALVGDQYGAGLFRVSPTAGGKLHQVGKPLDLMRPLLDVCGPRILDPFMGSASTGVVAIEAGKQFTGIEKTPHYFDVSVNRIRSVTHRREEIVLPVT